MESAPWLNRTLIAIVFERRHQAYGAFQIRRHYDQNMSLAILLSIGLFIGGWIALSAWQNRAKQSDLISASELYTSVELETILNKPKPAVVTPPATAPRPSAPQQSFLVPTVVVDEAVTEVEAVIPTEESLSMADVGITEVEGNGEIGNTIHDGETNGTSDVEIIAPPTPVQIYEVQQKPEFPGGESMMFKYLQENLRYPAAARESGISGTVVVRFVVSREGRIEQVEIVRSASKLFNEEALRAIRAMPVWRPGIANGKPVPVYFIIPLKFELI